MVLSMNSVFLRSALDTFNAYGRNPLLLVPALALFLALALFRKASLVVLPQLQTNVANVFWTLLASLLLLLVLALTFTPLLVLATDIAHSRAFSLSRTLAAMRRSTVSVFSILLIVRGASAFLLFLALGAGNVVRDVLDFGSNAAFFVALIITLLGFMCGLLFFAFAPAACVFYNQGIRASMRTSARLVHKHYGSLLLVSVLISLIVFLIGRFLPELASELVKSFVLMPLLALYLCFILGRLGGKR